MKKVAWWAVVASLFIIPFIPLYVANGLYFPFITGKAFAFRILVEVALMGYVVLACRDRAYRPRFSWVFVIYALFTAWLFIADLFAVNAHKALWSNYERMDGFVTLAHVFLFFVIAGVVLTKDWLWRKWWLTFLSGAALVCGYSFLQLMGSLVIHQGGGRVDATFGNAAYLPAYLLFVIAIAVWQALDTATKSAWLRYALYALALASAFIVYETQTRGAVLGLIGGIAVASLLWMLEAGKKGRMIAGGFLVAVLLLIGGFFLAKDSSFVQGNPTLARVSSISGHDLAVRTTLWKMAYDGVLARPVTGYGQEGFNYIFQAGYQPSMYAQEPWFDRAHNTFIDWMVSGGFPALLLFLALLGSASLSLYRRTASRPERVMLIAAFAAYSIQALVVFDNLFTYVPLAALLAMAHVAIAKPWKAIERLPEVAGQATDTVVAPIALVAGLALIWFVNVPGISAAGNLVNGLAYAQSDPAAAFAHIKAANDAHGFAEQEVAEQTLAFAGQLSNRKDAPPELTQEAFTYAFDRMNALITKVPNDARLRVEYATALRAAGASDRAAEEIAIARQLSPKKQTIALEAAYGKLQGGKFDEASVIFNETYQLDTSFTDLAIYAAAGDIFAGDPVSGKALLMEALGTTTPDSQILVLAYYQTKDYDAMIATLRSRITAADSVEARVKLVQGLAATGRYQEARHEAQELAHRFPDAGPTASALMAQLPK